MSPEITESLLICLVLILTAFLLLVAWLLVVHRKSVAVCSLLTVPLALLLLIQNAARFGEVPTAAFLLCTGGLLLFVERIGRQERRAERRRRRDMYQLTEIVSGLVLVITLVSAAVAIRTGNSVGGIAAVLLGFAAYRLVAFSRSISRKHRHQRSKYRPNTISLFTLVVLGPFAVALATHGEFVGTALFFLGVALFYGGVVAIPHADKYRWGRAVDRYEAKQRTGLTTMVLGLSVMLVGVGNVFASLPA